MNPRRRPVPTGPRLDEGLADSRTGALVGEDPAADQLPSGGRGGGGEHHRIPECLIAALVILLGTVNMWKVQSIQSRVPIDLTTLSVVLGTAVTAAALIRRRLRLPEGTPTLLFGFALFGPALLGTSFANPYSLLKAQAVFSLCLLAAAAPMILIDTRQRRIALVATATALGLLVAVWLLVAGTPTADTIGRVQIDQGNPIALGRAAALGLVPLALRTLGTRGPSRWLSAFGAAVCGAGAAATGSRGPLAAAIAAIALCTLLSRRSGSRLPRAAGLIVLALASWQVAVSVTPLSALDRLGGATGGVTDRFRVRLLAESLDTAMDHPGGVGWGDLGDYLSSSARADLQGWVQHPHNILVEVLVEGGLLALAGLAILLVESFRKLRSIAADLDGEAMLGLWLFAVGSALTSGDILANRMVWMMIGLGLAVAGVPHRAGAPSSMRAQPAPDSSVRPPHWA